MRLRYCFLFCFLIGCVKDYPTPRFSYTNPADAYMGPTWEQMDLMDKWAKKNGFFFGGTIGHNDQIVQLMSDSIYAYAAPDSLTYRNRIVVPLDSSFSRYVGFQNVQWVFWFKGSQGDTALIFNFPQ